MVPQGLQWWRAAVGSSFASMLGLLPFQTLFTYFHAVRSVGLGCQGPLALPGWRHPSGTY